MEDLGFNVYDKFNEVFNEKFNFWDVDEVGNVVRKDQRYEIGFERLTETNWLNHIIRKNEITAESEFYFAFVEALRRAGFKRLIINLEDETRISAEKQNP